MPFLNKMIGLSSKTFNRFGYSSLSGLRISILFLSQNSNSISENFNVSDTAVFQEIKKEVKMQKIEEGKKIVLNNIFFQTGKSELTESSALEIGKLYDLLKQNPKINVEISGHTDNVGGDAENMKLSFDRAKVVVEALITKGIPTERMIAKGYGKSQPIAPNDTPENKQLNRRTEFKILGQTKN